MKKEWFFAGGVLIILSIPLGLLTSCATTQTSVKDYTEGGNLAAQREVKNNQLDYDLQRVFINTAIEGIGIIENENEGLARKGALELAKADLAGNVQTKIRNESAIYNQRDIRDLVESQINALIGGYTVESSGYDPGTIKYRVRIAIKGERLIKEIETRVKR